VKRTGLLQNLAQMLRYGRPPLWTIVVIPVALVLTSTLSVVPPILVGRIIDGLGSRNPTTVLQQLGWYSLATVIVGLVQLVSGYASTIFRETQVRNLRTVLVTKLNQVQLDAVSSLTPGEIKNRIVGDVEGLSIQLQYTLFPTLASLASLAATIAAMVHLDVRFAAVAVALSLLTLLPMKAAAGRIAALHKQQAEAADELYGELQEGVTPQGLSLYRNPNAGARRLSRFEDITSRIFRTNAAQSILSQCTDLSSALLSMLGPAAVLAIGAYLVLHHQITTGTVVTALIYQSRMAAPFNTLSSLQATFATLKVIMTRLLQILDLPDESSGHSTFVPGGLAILDVALTRDRRPVLRGANLAVQQQGHVAVVGPSGGGKSTLASLILRLSDPQSGYITIGGIEIAQISLDSLRNSVALVPQDPLLLDASLHDNLTLMQPEATDSTVAAVLADCALDDVVCRLPDGLQTRVGQRGFRLSGGERQRVCVARAVLQDPHILILDEALSGVDFQAEREILNRLRARFRGRMLITITHRIHSTVGFDHVFVMDAGRVVAANPRSEGRARSHFAVT
jgi:ATP-binding cassette subfamily B protein